MNICIFASGNGSNFEAIVKAIKNKELNLNKCILFSDKKNAYVLERAKKYNIENFVLSLNDFNSKEEYEREILSYLNKENIDLILLAGYMKIIGTIILSKYENRIINIHPSLLPSFKGKNAIQDALNYGVKITGVTVHYVDSGIDTGKIILQEAVDILENDTIKSLSEKIHNVEHRIFIQALKLLI
ncbi:MAG: phosphoribosylglycinamide formyltransferase [Defluviitaleaceae bacterium]|nr:phosphoribosylglycinamide formyltransferase [Defluviitaleaceae bacterium]